jgi:sulfatase maturation enzyme AslB (radical SAM superfamily)
MPKTLDETLGVCSTCLRTTPAKIVENNGKVFLQKNCCNKENVLIDNDAEIYKKLILPFKTEREYIKCGETLNKAFKKMRKISLVTHITITHKCNLNCPICYLKFQDGMIAPDPSLDNILNVVKENRSPSIFLTGGEPTLRDDLPEIIKKISKMKKKTHIITNGLKLSNRRYVKKLKKAGLKEVYLSFDGLDDKIFRKFRGKKLLKIKLKALKNLKEEKIPTWLIAVMKLGFNVNQIPALLKFASLNNDFIEGVYFFSLFEGENTRNTYSDIIKKIAGSSNIDVDFFVKYKKFRFGVYELIEKILNKKIRMFDDFFYDNFPFKISNTKIEPFISYEWLKEMNLLFKKIKFNKFQTLSILFKNIKNVFKTIDLFSIYFLHRIRPSLSHLIQRKDKIIRIAIGRTREPHSIDLCRLPTIIEGGKINYLHDGGYTDPYENGIFKSNLICTSG